MVDIRFIPQMNIGTVGHVDHGKSTLVEAISGKWPAAHSEELKRGITIKLGYADVTVYKCQKGGEYTTSQKCITHSCDCEPVRTFSFVDAPGHETLMATVLAGANLMDAVLFVIAANEKCPQPQTAEHLMVLDIVKIKNIIIVQNKIDLVDKQRALENYKEIKEFVKGTIAENAPIVPVSAQQKINIDILLDIIQERFKTPVRDPNKPAKMLVVRSFDVNKPGTKIKDLVGGVLGGSLVQGRLKVGDKIEIRPGLKIKERWQPLQSKVVGLQKAGKNLEEAGPGGLLGLLTELDPALTKADSLSGSVLGHPGALPPICYELELEAHFFKKEKPREGERLMINIGVARTIGVIKKVKGSVYELELKLPVAAEAGDRAALSKLIGDRWHLIGWGVLR